AGNHLLDLPGLEQQAEPVAVDAGVVADASEVLDARIAHCVNELVGNADQPEAAAHHHHAVAPHALERRLGILVDLVRHHPILLPPHAWRGEVSPSYGDGGVMGNSDSM